MSDYCATCGWPHLQHREGGRCPYSRKRRDGSFPTFTPRAQVAEGDSADHGS